MTNQMARLERAASVRGWTVVYRLSDNDIGVTRKDPTKPGKYRPGYEEAMRLVDARAVDAVLCFKWDRFIREPLDLEYLIPRFDKAGVRFAEVDGNIDLGTDSGRLAARILIAVAKAEQERKAERQKLANEQAAINGKRVMGGPRPLGYREDHVTAHPAEGPAVAGPGAALLGGVALCPCGRVVSGGPSHRGHGVSRCSMPTGDRSWPGVHVARQAEPVEDFITRLVVGRLSRPDAADLVAVSESGPDVVALREEAAAIRRNLEEMAADRALGLISRPQMLAATEPAHIRLA